MKLILKNLKMNEAMAISLSGMIDVSEYEAPEKLSDQGYNRFNSFFWDRNDFPNTLREEK